jgi:hypothetical protein
MSAARYQISIDGVARTHRDLPEIAIEAAKYLKLKNPQSRVVLRDLTTDETTLIDAGSGAAIILPPKKTPSL